MATALGERVEHLAEVSAVTEQHLLHQVVLLDQALQSMGELLLLMLPQHGASSVLEPSQTAALFAATGLAEPPPPSPPPVRDWSNLPPELLSTILHPNLVGREARAVCTRFRAAFDSSVQRATLRLPSPSAMVQDLPRGPACACAVKLDVAGLHLGRSWGRLGWSSLASGLQRWPVTCPLQLDLSDNDIGAQAARLLAVVLRCPGVAPGGVQVLDLTRNRIGYGASHLADALRASPQLAGLRELRLASCGLRGKDAAALCEALQAATHVRSLALLDLSQNDLGQQGVAALAACLHAAPHLWPSLRQLPLAAVGMDSEGASELAAVVAECRVSLSSLELSDNRIDDAGAAAWAATLAASTSLAGLEALDVCGNCIGDDGVARLSAALLAASHLTRLRRVALFSPQCGAPGKARFAGLLAAPPPHLAASLQDLSLRRCDLSGCAMAVLCAAALAPAGRLPHLRRLDLSHSRLSEGGEGVRLLCSQLRAATHLTGLQQLDLSGVELDEAQCDEVAAALAASPHLSGLQELPLGEDLSAALGRPQRLARLLRDAPHLRGLTALAVRCEEGGPGAMAGLRTALELLPRLRSLALHGVSIRPAADMLELAAALQHAPCTPGLQQLTIGWVAGGPSEGAHDSAAIHLATTLQSCPRLTGLRRLVLSFAGQVSVGALAWLGSALAGARHLSGLREVCLAGGSCSADASDAMRQVLSERLAAGHLAGVHVASE